jgi:hypothetical protein
VASGRPYRQVEARRAPETPVPVARVEDLRARLLAALRQRTTDLPEFPAKVSLSHLADMLSLRLPLGHAERHAYYAELDVERRAQRLLLEHDTAP